VTPLNWSRKASTIAAREDIHPSMQEVFIQRLERQCGFEWSMKIEGRTRTKVWYHLVCGKSTRHGGMHEDVGGGVWGHRGRR
jgi:hypothetical protein